MIVMITAQIAVMMFATVFSEIDSTGVHALTWSLQMQSPCDTAGGGWMVYMRLNDNELPTFPPRPADNYLRNTLVLVTVASVAMVGWFVAIVAF